MVYRQEVCWKIGFAGQQRMHQHSTVRMYKHSYVRAHYVDKIRQQSLAYRHIVYHKINLAEGLDGLVISECLSTTRQPM